MNVLVTGAAGFIGRHLVDRLRRDHAVYALWHDLPIPGSEAVCLPGDVEDYRRMLEIIVNREIDQIYHLAAKSIVRNCRLDPLGCFQTNLMGTVNVLEAARQSQRVRGILVAESDKSYGRGPIPYEEDQALRPQGIYEASKACVSHVCAAYHGNFGLPVASLRTANVWGERDPNRSRLVPNTILRLLKDLPPQITTGAADFRREFIYVGDAIEAYVRIMAASAWGQAINVGSGELHTVGEAVALICEAMGKPLEGAAEWPRPASLVEIPDQILCIERLREIWPDYRPRKITDLLPSVIESYRN